MSFAALLLLNQSAMAASYGLMTTIPITPKNPTSFDIGWVDPGSHRYYLADKTNHGVDVIDTRTNTFLMTITGFVGANGILVVPPSHEEDSHGGDDEQFGGGLGQLWVGDNPDTTGSSVKVVDLNTNTITHTIYTGGVKRADELAFDAKDGIILMANDQDTPPFITFISTTTYAILGKISYPQATAGIEQSVWDQHNGMFYLNLPATVANPGGEVDEINPVSMAVVHTFGVTGCMPAGLALGSHQHLLLGCSGGAIRAGFHASSIIMDARDGDVVATITQVGGSDEVWYNPGDGRFYLAASGMTSDGTKTGTSAPVLGVIDSEEATWLFNVPTTVGAHSVAVDPSSNHAFVPLRVATTPPTPPAGLGIGVFGAPDEED